MGPLGVLCSVVGGSCLCTMGCLRGHFADGSVVVGLWVLVLCLGFSYGEAYLLGSGNCRDLHHMRVYPNQNLSGVLPEGWGFLRFWIFCSLVVWVFLWGLRAGLVSAGLLLGLFVSVMAS